MGKNTGVSEMNDVVALRLEEPVRLDRDQLEILFLRLGASGADQVVNQAMEDLAVELARVEKNHRAGRIEEVRGGVRQLVTIGQQVGMTSLARIGRDALELIDGFDGAAYCAVIARLVRVGESSLVAVWDLQGATV